MRNSDLPHDRPGRLLNRRSFLERSAAAAAAGAFAVNLSFPRKTFAANSETLRVGLVGCGGRGTGAAAQALAADSNVTLTALGDVFQDRLQNSLKVLHKQAGERVEVTPDNCFIGLDAYKHVIASGVDVVLLATPPGFRPQHLKAAIEAGKHVFCEKPMAVDAPGVRTLLQCAEQARQKKLALVSGFCWRYNYGEREAMRQVHNGAIGDLTAVQTVYNTGSLWSRARQPGWSDLEWQLRNWLYFTWLSGDHIVEQAVHSIDKMAWAMQDVPPVRATAIGGRQVRTDPLYGHIYDHFGVTYEYASGARGFHFCRQQANCSNDNSDTIMGTKGTLRIVAFGPLEIRGEKNWRFRGERPDMYQVEHNELFASIRQGNPVNDGVWMAHSTMTAILGRMAAYTGRTITWEEALNSEEDLVPENLDWTQPLPVPPVAMPGATPFV
jgi:myo-inositol 2-dehydrogenase / D-chiro-inositol 1-dehydrogenase